MKSKASTTIWQRNTMRWERSTTGWQRNTTHWQRGTTGWNCDTMRWQRNTTHLQCFCVDFSYAGFSQIGSHLQFPWSCFGRHALWGILGFFIQWNSQCPRWWVSCPQFTWVYRTSQWTPLQTPHAFVSSSKPHRQILSARAAPFILAGAIPLMRSSSIGGVPGDQGWWTKPSVPMSKQATSFACFTQRLAQENFGLGWNFG